MYVTTCRPSSISITVIFFLLNATTTTEIYTLSLHDALPISTSTRRFRSAPFCSASPIASWSTCRRLASTFLRGPRSEEHTSELQSRLHLVCRLLLEKKTDLIEHHEAHQYQASSHQRVYIELV